jgi:hypothetical protein
LLAEKVAGVIVSDRAQEFDVMAQVRQPYGNVRAYAPRCPGERLSDDVPIGRGEIGDLG